MNYYRDSYDKLIYELDLLEENKKDILEEYRELSTEYRDITNRYNDEIRTTLDVMDNCRYRFCLLFNIFGGIVFLELVFIILGLYFSFLSLYSIQSFLVVIGSFAIPFSLLIPLIKKYINKRKHLLSEKRVVEDKYVNDIEVIRDRLLVLSNELNELNVNISCKRRVIDSVVKECGELYLGIFDNTEEVDRVYTKKRVISDSLN